MENQKTKQGLEDIDTWVENLPGSLSFHFIDSFEAYFRKKYFCKSSEIVIATNTAAIISFK